MFTPQVDHFQAVWFDALGNEVSRGSWFTYDYASDGVYNFEVEYQSHDYVQCSSISAVRSPVSMTIVPEGVVQDPLLRQDVWVFEPNENIILPNSEDPQCDQPESYYILEGVDVTTLFNNMNQGVNTINNNVPNSFTDFSMGSKIYEGWIPTDKIRKDAVSKMLKACWWDVNPEPKHYVDYFYKVEQQYRSTLSANVNGLYQPISDIGQNCEYYLEWVRVKAMSLDEIFEDSIVDPGGPLKLIREYPDECNLKQILLAPEHTTITIGPGQYLGNSEDALYEWFPKVGLSTPFAMTSELIVDETNFDMNENKATVYTLQITHKESGRVENYCSKLIHISAPIAAKSIGHIENDYKENIDLRIFPNPTSDVLTVTFSGEGVSELVVSNMFGQILMSFPVRSNQVQIDMNTFANGVYILTLLDAQGNKWVEKIVKQ